MIGLSAAPGRQALLPLVVAAFQRSVGRRLARPAALAAGPAIAVLVDPPADWDADIAAWLAAGPKKLIVFGHLPPALRSRLGHISGADSPPAEAAASPAAATHGTAESPAFLQYGERAALLGGSAWRRPLSRYDFADEWNNLGYGAIGLGSGDWDIGPALGVASADELAALHAPGHASSYAALFDRDGFSLLWFNRPAGPIDSFEWRLVENFLSGHRADALPVLPVLSEIPFGHDAAVTMRLDCDEDLLSAAPLREAYRGWGKPFSVAILTRELTGAAQAQFLRDLLASGGSVLSHSVTHAPHWGGSYAAALAEATGSADALAAATGQRPLYAVAPFHNVPHYALEALAAAGYSGCIGGRISDEPAFNLARGGLLAGLPAGFVGHSQQCMLHGDCLVAGPDPLATYRQAFDLAYESRTLFGYLDHPFSARYQYGWADEPARIAAHRTLLDHIERRAARPLFLSAGAALDFLAFRQRIELVAADDGYRVILPADAAAFPAVAAEFRGATVQLADGMQLR